MLPAPLYELTKFFLRVFFRTYHRLTIEGWEQLPKDGPVLAIVNHASNYDPVLATICIRGRTVRVMGKEELWRSRPLAALLDAYGAFPVNRGAADKRALLNAIKALKAGEVLLVLPEGTRTRTGEMQPFELGAARLAYAAPGVRICPARIRGAFEAYGPGVRFPKPGKITIRFGTPYEPPPLEGDSEAKKS
ncbi:1-acyl-sn-glycerol-3-phosphate acyltransferase [Candidatus Poribacteria bacterium]|nr:1-acyl-sn-glycerol-3-phosphate acyltransferase [Candidatus Poribacteria bacterium]